MLFGLQLVLELFFLGFERCLMAPKLFSRRPEELPVFFDGGEDVKIASAVALHKGVYYLLVIFRLIEEPHLPHHILRHPRWVEISL